MKKVAAFVGSLLVVGAVFADNIPQDMNFSGKVNFDKGCDLRINNSAMTSSAADLNLAGNTAKVTVNSAVTVTNGSTLALVAGQMNILTPTGQIPLGTNTVTIGVAGSSDIGKLTIIQNAQTATNILKIAASTGFYYGPEINLASNECAVVIATATNKYVSLGNQ